MNFYNVITSILLGKKVKRASWDKPAYCLLAAERLCIFVDDKLQDWLVSEEDMRAEDWIIVPEATKLPFGVSEGHVVS